MLLVLECQRLSFLCDYFCRQLVHYHFECCHVYCHASDMLEGCG